VTGRCRLARPRKVCEEKREKKGSDLFSVSATAENKSDPFFSLFSSARFLMSAEELVPAGRPITPDICTGAELRRSRAMMSANGSYRQGNAS
jgi:hypothetical protein